MNELNILLSLDNQAQQYINLIVKKGETVIDATAGNGHDTLFLAKLVDEQGIVFAFDIQEKAIQNTSQLLLSENCLKQVQLINISHDQAKDFILKQSINNISAIMFNLGFLPGSDKTICTKSSSTLNACKNLLPLLKIGGIMTIHAYTGIHNSKNEVPMLIDWAKSLQWKNWHVTLCTQLNKIKNTEHLLCIHRLH